MITPEKLKTGEKPLDGREASIYVLDSSPWVFLR